MFVRFANPFVGRIFTFGTLSVVLLFITLTADDRVMNSETPTAMPAETHNNVSHASEWKWQSDIRRQVSALDTPQQFRNFIESESLPEDNYLRNLFFQYFYLGFTSVSPRHAFEDLLNRISPPPNELVTEIFWQWALSDLDQALKSALTLPDALSKCAIVSILQSEPNLDAEIRLQLGKIIYDVDTVKSAETEIYLKEAKDDPQGVLINLLNDDRNDHDQIRIFASITQQLLSEKTMTMEAILDKLPNSFLRRYLISTVAREFAKSNPQEALAFAARGSSDWQMVAIEAVVREWAHSNPEATMEAINAASIDSNSKVSLQVEVMLIWLKTDPELVLRQVDPFPTNIRSTIRKQAITSIAEVDPVRAVELVDLFNLHSLDVISAVASRWARHDALGSLEWSLKVKLDNDIYRTSLLSNILGKVTEKDPIHALNLASRYSTDGAGISLVRVVMDRIAGSNVDSAIELLEILELNKGQKLDAYSSIGEALIMNGNLERAFVFGDRISVDLRRNYHQFLIDVWATYDPKELYESLDSLPVSGMKQFAIQELLSEHRIERKLSNDQLNGLKDRSKHF